MDDIERFIDPRRVSTWHEMPLGTWDIAAGETRCMACGGDVFEQFGTAIVTCRIAAVVGFDQDALLLQASDVLCADDDFEPLGFECASCGIEARDLAEIAESRPWEIGARAVLPDGTEAHIEAIGRDRTMGNHREPTAMCGGATYLLRDLRPIKPFHPDQLALPI
jgi:hypothetical protein